MRRKIVLILLVIIIGGVLISCGKKEKKEDFENLEKRMTELAEQYYNEQLKDFVKGLNVHEISLEAMEKAGYNIDLFEEKKCTKTSYSEVLLTLDENREVVGNYTIKNYLNCSNYKTSLK